MAANANRPTNPPEQPAPSGTEAKLPDTVVTDDGTELVRTKAGLPNTCSVTGEPCEGTWFAKNEQAALAGQGFSEAHVRALVTPV